MNKKLKLGILLFTFGFIGVLSTLTMEIPLPEGIKEMVYEVFTPFQFKLLSLINPTIFLTIAVVLGTVLYDKVNLQLPIFEKFIFKRKADSETSILTYGIIGGLLAGGLITLISAAFMPALPKAFIEMGEKFNPNFLVRFLYGGITEEIIVRFGLMTFLAWIMFRIVGNLNSVIFWSAIIISSILFGLGHLPLAITLAGNPTPVLLLYIILGNAVGGFVFGWLYWKKGLETAMLAHIFAHIAMVLADGIFG